jgi:hypothetical protein
MLVLLKITFIMYPKETILFPMETNTPVTVFNLQRLDLWTARVCEAHGKEAG